jgi:iron complex transport system permease protein
MTFAQLDRAATPARPLAAARRRALWVSLLLLAGLAALSVLAGYQIYGPAEVLAALMEHDPDEASHIVLREIRLPRVIGACLAGMALGASGALLQILTRNPLADPGLLGVNAGAALGVVLCIVLFGLTDPGSFVWAALIGAFLVSLLVLLIGGNAEASPVRLLIAGAALMIVSLSVIRALLLLSRQGLETYRFWVLGGLDGVSFETLSALAPFLLVGAVLAMLCAFWLNGLALGTEVARGLGLPIWLVQILVGGAVVLLCGSTVAMAGPLAFVGLVAAHVARLFARGDASWHLLLAAVTGALMLLLADLLGRLAFFGGNLQAGVMSALVGGPLLIWMVRRGRGGLA